MSGDEVSRRAVLGGAVGFPLLPTAGAGIAPPPAFAFGYGRAPSPSKLGEEWEEALAAFEAAEAKVWEIEAATAGYRLADEAVLLPAHDAACEAMEVALQRILFVPAPHLRALGIKFEAAFAHELRSSPDDDLRFRAIMRDVIRLWAADVRSGGPARREGL